MDALPQRPQEARGEAAAAAASAYAANGQGAPQRKEKCGVFGAAPPHRPGRDLRHGPREAVPDWLLYRHYAADVTQYNTAFSFGACAWSPC